MPKERQRPRLLRGPLSGRIYVVTRYRDLGNGMFEAKEKYDVTDEFLVLAASSGPVYSEIEDDALPAPSDKTPHPDAVSQPVLLE